MTYRTHRLSEDEWSIAYKFLHDEGYSELAERIQRDAQGKSVIRTDNLVRAYEVLRELRRDEICYKLLKSNTDWLEAQDIAFPERTYESMEAALYTADW